MRQRLFFRCLIRTTLALILLTPVVASTQASPSETQLSGVNEARNVGGKFIHTVLFWLKPGTTTTDKEKLMLDCRALLGSIPSVRFLTVGEPAGTPREVVDNSFDVGLVVHFDGESGHDAYQEASEHQEFIERNSQVWERVQVYDIRVP